MMNRESYRRAVDSVSFSPDFQERTEDMLRRQAAMQGKENLRMKFIKRPAVIVAIAALLVVSVSAAVVASLSASDVADRMGMPALAQAFRDGGMEVSETVETGGYAVTFMGTASGQALDELNPDLDGTHTYAVVSLEKLDGTPLEQDAVDLTQYTLTALVKGCEPWAVNNWTLGCSVTGASLDGRCYLLLDAGSLGVFADRTVYLAFYTMEDGFAPSAGIFNMAEDGEISFTENVKGPHALFEIPLDESLADHAAADAIIAQWTAPADDTVDDNTAYDITVENNVGTDADSGDSADDTSADNNIRIVEGGGEQR